MLESGGTHSPPPCTVTNLHHLTPQASSSTSPGLDGKAYTRCLLTQQWWSVAGEVVHCGTAVTGLPACRSYGPFPPRCDDSAGVIGGQPPLACSRAPAWRAAKLAAEGSDNILLGSGVPGGMASPWPLATRTMESCTPPPCVYSPPWIEW